MLDVLIVNGAVRSLEAQLREGSPYPLAQPNQLYRQTAPGRFEEVSSSAGAAFLIPEVSRGSAFGDVDNDGDTDVVMVNNSGPARLFINNVGQDNGWIGLRAVDPETGSDLLGAQLEVFLEDGSVLWRQVKTAGSYGSASDPRLIVGLGGDGRVAKVRVHWPPDEQEEFYRPDRRPIQRAGQGGGGPHLMSCGLGKYGLGEQTLDRLALLLLVLAALACGGDSKSEPELLEALPTPAAGDVAEAALAQFTEARSRVAAAAGTGGDAGELATALGDLGQLYLVHEYPTAALECFRHAQESDPKEARWPYLAGYVRQLGGDLEAATGAFEQVLELRPDYPPALYRLGEVELDGNRPAAAAAHFRRALEIDPASAGAHYGLGRAALAQQEFALAITELTAVLAAQPDATKIHHALGLAYRGAGDLERAQNHLSRRGDGDIRLADPWIAEIDQLAAQDSGHVRSGIEAGRQGDRQRALGEFRAALEADPTDLIARHNLAVSLTRNGDLAGAEAQYREILDRDPANSQAAFGLGNLLAQQGRLEEAIAQLRRSLEGADDFKQARMNLAAALGRAGRWQEAVAEYDVLLQLDPESASVRSLRSLASGPGRPRRRRHRRVA